MVNIQHGRQPKQPLRFEKWGQHCAVCYLSSFLKRPILKTNPQTSTEHFEPKGNPLKQFCFLNKNIVLNYIFDV